MNDSDIIDLENNDEPISKKKKANGNPFNDNKVRKKVTTQKNE